MNPGDQRDRLAVIEGLVGKETAEAFVTVMKNSPSRDPLGTVLQVIVDAKLSDGVVKQLVAALVDPAFDAGNATDDEIMGFAHMLQGAFRSQSFARKDLPEPEQIGSRDTRAADQPFLGSADWKALLQDTADSRALAATLDAEDISSLILHLVTAPAKEQAAVLELLQLAIKQNPITEHQKQGLVAAIRPLLTSYPDGTARAFIVMCQLAPAVAREFLLEEVDALRIPEWRFRSYLMDLVRIHSIATLDRVLQYRKLEGPKGLVATRLVKTLGIIDQKEVEDLAAQWRETKSLKVLNSLYEFHVEHQGGKPMEPLLELLGPWNRHDFNSYWYDSVEGPSLFLQQDEHGNLSGFTVK